MRKINVALLGCGRVAEHYRHVLLNSTIQDLVEVIVVCDLNIERALALSNSLDCDAISNIDEFDKYIGQLDAVFVLTPSGVHFEKTQLCFWRKGLMLFVRSLLL